MATGELSDRLEEMGGAVLAARLPSGLILPFQPRDDGLQTVPPTPIARHWLCRRCWREERDTEAERDEHEAQCAEGRETVALTETQKIRARNLIALGRSAQEIASELGVSYQSVNALKTPHARVHEAAEAERKVNGDAHQDEGLHDQGEPLVPDHMPAACRFCSWRGRHGDFRTHLDTEHPGWAARVGTAIMDPTRIANHGRIGREPEAPMLERMRLSLGDMIEPAVWREAEKPMHILRFCDVIQGDHTYETARNVVAGLLPTRRYRLTITAEEVRDDA